MMKRKDKELKKKSGDSFCKSEGEQQLEGAKRIRGKVSKKEQRCVMAIPKLSLDKYNHYVL